MSVFTKVKCLTKFFFIFKVLQNILAKHFFGAKSRPAKSVENSTSAFFCFSFSLYCICECTVHSVHVNYHLVIDVEKYGFSFDH